MPVTTENAKFVQGQHALPASRSDILTSGLGLLSQTFPRGIARDSSVVVDGTIYFMALGLRGGDVVSNFIVDVSSPSATTTVSKLGLYKKDGTRVAISADQGTSWETTGTKTAAALTPYAVPTDDLYYGALICKASVTLPQFYRCVASATLIAIAGASVPYGTQAGQTDLIASATIGVAGTPQANWFGVN